MITRFFPTEPTFVGYYLRRRFPVRWAASLNDPPTSLSPPPYSDGRPNSLQSFEFRRLKKALALADRVIFPSVRLAGYYQQKLGCQFQAPPLVVPHIGWKEDSTPPISDKFEIVHAGPLRTPRVSAVSASFFTCFSRRLPRYPGLADRIKFTVLGGADSVFQRFLQENQLETLVQIENHDSFEKSQRRIAKADALLLIEAPLSEGIFLPSKFSDYAVSGKPLLLLSPEPGAISDLVGGYRHPGFLGHQEKLFEPMLDRFLDRIAQKQSLADYACPRPQDFEPRHVVKDLLARLR
jgi:hypothetical protein